MKWLAVLLGFLYAVLPLDVLPDPIVGLGWLDDLLLAGLIWYWFFRRPGGSTRGTRPDDRRASDEAGNQYQGDASGQAAPGDDPYRVLGVPPGADQAAIRAAYRRLAAQYHPDKVAHLGPDFQLLAEKKFKAIQAAYETLRSRT